MCQYFKIKFMQEQIVIDENKLHENFGLNFKISRIKLKLSQEDICDKTNLSQVYISNIENGKHKLSLANALILSKAVNRSIYDLIKDI